MVGPRQDSALFAEWRRICWVEDKMSAEDVGVFLQRRGRHPWQRTLSQLTGGRRYECGAHTCAVASPAWKEEWLYELWVDSGTVHIYSLLLAVPSFFSKCPSVLSSGRKERQAHVHGVGRDPLLTCLSSSSFCKSFFLWMTQGRYLSPSLTVQVPSLGPTRQKERTHFSKLSFDPHSALHGMLYTYKHMCVHTCKCTYTHLNKFNSASNREILVKTKCFCIKWLAKLMALVAVWLGTAQTLAVALRGEFTDERCPRIVGIH